MPDLLSCVAWHDSSLGGIIFTYNKFLQDKWSSNAFNIFQRWMSCSRCYSSSSTHSIQTTHQICSPQDIHAHCKPSPRKLANQAMTHIQNVLPYQKHTHSPPHKPLNRIAFVVALFCQMPTPPTKLIPPHQAQCTSHIQGLLLRPKVR